MSSKDIIIHGSMNRLQWGEQLWPCVIGANGVTKEKQRGDKATPTGTFSIRQILWRDDRLALPSTRLPHTPIQPHHGWCQDPESPFYNQPIELPFQGNHQELMRDDDLFDVVIVAGDPESDNPETTSLLIHLKPEEGHTEGSIGLNKDRLLKIIQEASANSSIVILP